MSSASLRLWQTERSVALQEIQAAHASIGGVGPGRRYATQQINQAYVMLLSGQFQGFCRDPHTECVDYLVGSASPPDVQGLLRGGLLHDRKIDRGNPFPGNIGDDFNRLGVTFWKDVNAFDKASSQRQKHLETLNIWRNSIAHQSFDPSKLGGKVTVQLVEVRKWHAACDGLARTFDAVMGRHLAKILGTAPW